MMASTCGLRPTLFSIVEYPAIWRRIAKYGIEVRFDDSSCSALPFGDECFDYSFSCGVLEHVRETGGNEKDSLDELVRVTSKRVLIYHLPNKYSWIEFFTRHFSGSRYSHPYRYTRKDILGLASNLEGAVISRMGRYGVLPRRIGGRLNWRAGGSILHAVDTLLMYSPLRFFCQCWWVELTVKSHRE